MQLLTSSGAAQTLTLSGAVRERSTKETIPGVSLHILGTSRGARTNADGNYRLALDRGMQYVIRVTAIGYRPDTLNVTLFRDSTENIALVAAPVTGRVVTISANSTRDEARRIMHKVIDSKDAWQSQIQDYQFHVYSRLNFKEQKD
ncbi:MAG TPA: carboxypeptidase-like regulatory domain-containing protein, partial [Candidatus Kapabacteria bacterium]|nr:carboxypeptidase-like regulatory domain-containing protein [Candidatus Kapabacteria bacterium]